MMPLLDGGALATMARVGAATVLAGLLFVAGYATHRWRHPPSSGIDHFAVREQAILSQAAQEPQVGTIVLGDSLTEFAELPSLCGEPVLNAGVGGIRVRQSIALVQQLAGAVRAKRVVLAVGLNDANKTQPRSGTTAADYKELVRAAASLGNVFVSTAGPFNPALRLGAQYDAIRLDEINRLIRGVAPAAGVKLIDLNSELSDEDGHLPLDETTDGVHLNAQGYVRWQALLDRGVCDAVLEP